MGAFLIGLIGCGGTPLPPPPPTSTKVVVDGSAMGGPLRVTVRCPAGSEATCQARCEAARDEVTRIEAIATDWTPTGEIARLNAAAGQGPQPVSPDVSTMLFEAGRIAKATDGAFDATINALWGLWDFAEGRVADPDELEARLPLVDWKGLTVAGGQASLAKEGMSVTLGGLAQGYAAERALALISDHEAMVDVSGDIATRGTWRVGVQHPRASHGQLIAALSVTDAVIVTSGDYERFFEKDGQRYHHILDPRTGRPSTGAMSATVVAGSGSVADGLATALMVLGAKEAPVRKLDAWALVVLYDGRIVELGERGDRLSDLEVSAR